MINANDSKTFSAENEVGTVADRASRFEPRCNTKL